MIGSARSLVGMIVTGALLGAMQTIALPSNAIAATRTCGHQKLTQPFARWADHHLYQRISGGSFEGPLSGWSLQSGARRVLGGQPFAATGSSTARSLLLPSGASAESPSTCINTTDRSFRLFARALTPGAHLTALITYPTAFGAASFRAAVITPSTSWHPTQSMSTAAALVTRWGGGVANVQFRFTASGGPVEIDDVYVDPHGRCC